MDPSKWWGGSSSIDDFPTRLSFETNKLVISEYAAQHSQHAPLDWYYILVLSFLFQGPHECHTIVTIVLINTHTQWVGCSHCNAPCGHRVTLQYGSNCETQ